MVYSSESWKTFYKQKTQNVKTIASEKFNVIWLLLLIKNSLENIWLVICKNPKDVVIDHPVFNLHFSLIRYIPLLFSYLIRANSRLSPEKSFVTIKHWEKIKDLMKQPQNPRDDMDYVVFPKAGLSNNVECIRVRTQAL